MAGGHAVADAEDEAVVALGEGGELALEVGGGEVLDELDEDGGVGKHEFLDALRGRSG